MLLAANTSPILLSIVAPYLVGAIICLVAICVECIWERLQASSEERPTAQNVNQEKNEPDIIRRPRRNAS